MGIIFDIQRCSYHDGPGIRTTVFLKGCQLRCAWCHNPESFDMRPQLQYISHRCTNCGACAASCPCQVHSFRHGHPGHLVDFSACTACGACVQSCPSQALKILGYQADVSQIMEIVLKDRAYYDASGGGLTVSGGEPTTQPDFLCELLQLAQSSHIHTCLETNGYILPQVLDRLLPLTDLFLLDYKITDPKMRYQYTLAQSSLWEHTLDTLQAHSKPVILRLPIIPSINDTWEHISQAAELTNQYSVIQKAEIMPYHAIGAGKWEQLGLDYSLAGLPSATDVQKKDWQSMLTACLMGKNK